MSTSPSRRDLLGGLFAAGLAWLGLRRATEAAPGLPAKAPPLSVAPPPLVTYYIYDYDRLAHVTTLVYDCRDRLVLVQDALCVTTYSYDTYGGPPTPGSPEKT
jgi:hypothetical protein